MTNNIRDKNTSDNVHLYLAIKRKKENPDMKSHKEELCFRQVVYDEEEDLDILKFRISKFPGVWRIYKTVNARSVEKAKKVMFKWLIDGLYQHYRFDTLWKKALLQRECRAEKKALVDVDTNNVEKIDSVIFTILRWFRNKDNYPYKISDLMDVIETPNGFHIICKPFDKRILNDFDYACVDYDRFVFIEKLKIENDAR